MDRTPYTPDENERKLITRLMEIMKKGGYSPSDLPPIFVSSETPPIFAKYRELEGDHEGIPPDTISIEECFGVYRPLPEEIVIYERGIRWQGHHLDEEQLFAVVLIHEIAHWITHKLSGPGLSAWETDLYVAGETDVHEGWAQLMTWWIANQVGGEFKQVFETLNKKQSPPYQIFKRFKSVPVDRVIASLSRLRCLSSPARLQDWEETMGYAEWMYSKVWDDFLRTARDAGATTEQIRNLEKVHSFVPAEWMEFKEWNDQFRCALEAGFTIEEILGYPFLVSSTAKQAIKEGL